MKIDKKLTIKSRSSKLLYLVILWVVFGSNLLLSACSTSSDSSNNSSSNGGYSGSNPSVGSNGNNNGGSNGSGNTKVSVGAGNPTLPAPLGGKKAGLASLYPNPNLTPGDVFPGVTAKEVCVSGYSSGVRNVSAAEKDAVYQSYGIPNVTGQHEVDHFISLELGGSNDIKNLWPEPYEPRPGAHEKDTVENALHAAVCDGRMTLPQAQTTIRTDWYAYYLQLPTK